VDAILKNLNYEGGCNPVNVTYLTGLGWRRQREVVDQYSENDRRVLPKDGVPISNLEEGFVWTFTYGYEMSPLCFPSDGAQIAPYPMYDRWCDFFNVSTEASTTDTTRSFATAVWLAAQTALASQPWRYTNATISAPATSWPTGQPLTVTLHVADTDLSAARITWEAAGQEPTFGTLAYTFTPGPTNGDYWVEAEVQWPDGRRAFATNSITGGTAAVPLLLAPQSAASVGFSFVLAGTPGTAYIIQVSSDLSTWTPLVMVTLPASGQMAVGDPLATSYSRRYYRALQAP
jgi:hypothetical protein